MITNEEEEVDSASRTNEGDSHNMRTSHTRVAKSTGEPLDFSSSRSPSTIEAELYQDRLTRSAEERTRTASTFPDKSILTTCLEGGSIQLLSTPSTTAKAPPSSIRPKTQTSDNHDSTHMTLPLSKSLLQGRLDDADEKRKKITSGQLPLLQSNDRHRSRRKRTYRKRKRTPSENIDGCNTSRGIGGRKSTDVPSRPLSAYNIFFSDQRAKIMAEREANDGELMTSPESGAEDDGSMNETEQVKKKKGSSPFFERLAKRVGRRWRKLPEEERAKYIVLAKKDKQRYRNDLEALHQKKMTETIERVVAEQVKDLSRSSVVKGTSPDSQVVGVQIEMDSGLPSVPSRPASHDDPSPTQGYETWFASVVMAQSLLAHHDFALSAHKTGGSLDHVHRPNAHWSDIAGSLPLPPPLPGSLDSLTTEAQREMHHRPAILDANQQLTPWNPFLRPEEIILYETLKQQILGSGWQSPGLESFALAHQLLPVDKANHHMQWNTRQRPSEALSSFDLVGQSNLLLYNSPKTTFAALPRNAVNVSPPSKRQFDVALTTHHLNTQPQSVDILGLASNDDEKVQSIPVLPSTTSTFNKSKGDDHHTSTFQESRSNLLDCESNPSLLLPFLSSRTATSPEKKITVEEQKIHLKGATTVEEQKIQGKGATSNQGARLTLMNLAVQEFKNQQKPIRHLGSSSLVIGKQPRESRHSALSKTLRRRNSVIIHQHTFQQQQITPSMIHKSEKGKHNGNENRVVPSNQGSNVSLETPNQQTEIMGESVQNNTSGQTDNAEHVRILQQLERIRQQYSEQMQKASQNDPET